MLDFNVQDAADIIQAALARAGIAYSNEGGEDRAVSDSALTSSLCLYRREAVVDIG
jgi:hypothetical protein